MGKISVQSSQYVSSLIKDRFWTRDVPQGYIPCQNDISLNTERSPRRVSTGDSVALGNRPILTTKPKGFTLVELLVVVGIMAVTTAYLIPKFSNFGTKHRLNEIADTLQSDLRFVQNSAVSGVQCKTSDGTPLVDKTPLSWSIKFFKSGESYSYKILQNCAGIAEDAPLEDRPVQKEIPLNGVEILGFTTNTCSLEENRINFTNSVNPEDSSAATINIENISGKINFSHNAGLCLVDSRTRTLEIELALKDDNTIKKKVVVETGGSIYVSSN